MTVTPLYGACIVISTHNPEQDPAAITLGELPVIGRMLEARGEYIPIPEEEKVFAKSLSLKGYLIIIGPVGRITYRGIARLIEEAEQLQAIRSQKF